MFSWLIFKLVQGKIVNTLIFPQASGIVEDKMLFQNRGQFGGQVARRRSSATSSRQVGAKMLKCGKWLPGKRTERQRLTVFKALPLKTQLRGVLLFDIIKVYAQTFI